MGHMKEITTGERKGELFRPGSSGAGKTKADPVDPVDPPRLPQCTDVVKSPNSLDI